MDGLSTVYGIFCSFLLTEAPTSNISLTSPPTGAITPGFIIVTGMFYTRAEQNKRTGYWCKFYS